MRERGLWDLKDLGGGGKKSVACLMQQLGRDTRGRRERRRRWSGIRWSLEKTEKSLGFVLVGWAKFSHAGWIYVGLLFSVRQDDDASIFSVRQTNAKDEYL